MVTRYDAQHDVQELLNKTKDLLIISNTKKKPQKDKVSKNRVNKNEA